MRSRSEIFGNETVVLIRVITTHRHHLIEITFVSFHDARNEPEMEAALALTLILIFIG